MDFDTIQNQVEKWIRHNFQYMEPLDSMAAITEECSEFIEAINMHDNLEAIKEAEDAVGDTMIACCAYCTSQEWNLSEVYFDRSSGTKVKHPDAEALIIILGHLSRATLKGVIIQEKEKDYAADAKHSMQRLFSWMENAMGVADMAMEAKGRAMEAITTKIWLKVRKRDYNNQGRIKWRDGL